MAAIDFPSSPSVNQTHTASGITWTWDGTSWKAQGSTTTYTLPTASTGTLGGIKVGGNFAIDGAGTLSLSAAAISGLSDVTAASADYLMLWDASDSSLKKVDAGELLGGGGGGGLSSIGIQSGGTQVGSGITQLNFIGAGDTFAVSGNTVDVSIGVDSVDAILPVAYAVVGTNSAGTGTGMSWGAYNSSTKEVVFTFDTAQPNTNYYVHTNREHYATHNIEVLAKTTTGFTTKWTNSDTSALPPGTFKGVLIVYGSNPLTSVGSLNTNDGVVVKNDGSLVGTAGTINFGDSLSVTALSAGIVTVTSSHIRAQTLTVAGVSTFTGNIDANGMLDVDGPTHLDYVSVSGVTTFNGNVNIKEKNLILGDSSGVTNDRIVLGNSSDFHIYHPGTDSMIDNNTGDLYLRCNVNADVGGNIRLMPKASQDGIIITHDASVELYEAGDKKFETTGSGAEVTGTIVADAADIDDWVDVGNNIQLGNAGVITATSYIGSGSALTDLNATKITSGTVPTARLGSGTANNSVFLRGDNTWATPAGGSGTGYFAENSTGIHTTSNVGIGTTTASSTLTVGGSIETTTGGIQIGPNNTNTRSGSLGFGGAGSLSYSDNNGSSGNMATVLLQNTYGAANSDIHIKQRGDFEVQNLAGNAILLVDTSWTSSLVNSGVVHLRYKSNTSGSGLLTRLTTSATGVDLPTGSLKVDQGEIQVGSTFKAGQAGVVTATSYDGSGANLTALNASNIGSGTVPTARLGSGTANNSVFLRGDNTWATPSGGGSATTINNNADNRIITGSASANTLNAESSLSYDGTNLNFANDKKITFGNNLRMQIYTDGSDNFIKLPADGSGAFPLTIFSSAIEALKINSSGNTIIGGSLDAELVYHTAWTLGASGSSHYTFTGNGLDGAENDPTIYVIRGQKYAFKNRSGGHPFRIQTSFQNTSGTAYNDGVTNNSAGNGTDLIWNVQFDAPDVLYYQCTAHTNMSGKIIVLGSNVTAVTWTASAGSAHTIDTVAWNSFLSAEYTIHISHSTGIQSEKLLVMCDGTTGSDHHTEYAVMYSGSVLGTFSTTTSGSDVLVRFNPSNAGSTTIKFIKSIVQ